MRKFKFTLKHAFSKSARQNDGIISVRPRRFVTVLSNILTLAIMLGAVIPQSVDAYQAHTQNIAELAAAEAEAEARMNEIIRSKEEAARMKEFNAMRIALYCEAKANSAVTRQDMAAIAANILTRVASDEYPDTIFEVVYEKRVKKTAAGPLKVAMYSFINAPCARKHPSDSDMHWTLAGRETHKAMVAYEAGRLKTDSMNYHAPYVNPSWVKRGLQNCELEALGKRGFHLHYAKLSPSKQAECLAERIEAEKASASDKPVVLPKVVPVPAARPTKDEVAALIKTS
ncbi:MAG: hypothetical protein DI585_06610 [Pseudomonas fluorescens]|nr:MAG: hypothetical protein DI585_06610 [Pseudomonas fluorescens]